MRIIVDIPDAYRELIKELERYGSRQRAGRLRMLATMGLVTLHGGSAVPSANQDLTAVTTTEAVEDDGETEQRKARSDMGMRMMGSLTAK